MLRCQEGVVVRALGLFDGESDVAHLMRVAERAGLALACIDEASREPLPGDVIHTGLGRLSAWVATISLTVAFLIL
jgi:hypothetical protein